MSEYEELFEDDFVNRRFFVRLYKGNNLDDEILATFELKAVVDFGDDFSSAVQYASCCQCFIAEDNSQWETQIDEVEVDEV